VQRSVRLGSFAVVDAAQTTRGIREIAPEIDLDLRAEFKPRNGGKSRLQTIP